MPSTFRRIFQASLSSLGPVETGLRYRIWLAGARRVKALQRMVETTLLPTSVLAPKICHALVSLHSISAYQVPFYPTPSFYLKRGKPGADGKTEMGLSFELAKTSDTLIGWGSDGGYMFHLHTAGTLISDGIHHHQRKFSKTSLFYA